MSTDFSRLKRPHHPVPGFVAEALAERGLTASFANRPAYQQNDYIAWIERAKRPDTRNRRLNQMLHEVEVGGVYMKMSHAASAKA